MKGSYASRVPRIGQNDHRKSIGASEEEVDVMKLVD